MTRGPRWVGAACAALWLVPVAVVLWLTVNAWFFRDEPADDPHGYVGIFGLLFSVPALIFAGLAIRALWLLAPGRRGAGTWLLVVGILGGGIGVMLLPGALMPMTGPGTPGIEQSWPDWPLVGMAVAPLALAVVTIVAAALLMRAERPAPPALPLPAEQSPSAPGR
ncbi:hypothetical protein [Knoellia subterranea]|uniref:Uncharacterized protein n=1 Tax=Knoellia subterranea KCTC 19937 TaxID=1385521 RepID=A0A0A0JI35_9MICO|nr:hypothetical protein [Knoellia subterranea]KGN37020.1 hypothetical protein N803_16520 [Knoellia subterranea KCTC 19937]